jgi:hypothetical protein
MSSARSSSTVSTKCDASRSASSTLLRSPIGSQRRFDIEHTYRFAKNTLGWTTPALCTPEQADRWTWLVVAGYTQLRLARGLVADLRLPWERHREPGRLTPGRVRRGFRQLHPALGTPASPPKSDVPGPGRPKGTRQPLRIRYQAIKKAA